MKLRGRAVVHSTTGGSDVLRLVQRDVADPGQGEVRVRVHVSGVNPTDWKSRTGDRPGLPLAFPEAVPNQDGAGVVDSVGGAMDDLAPGDRVWIWEAAWQRSDGTAQDYVVLPRRNVVALPEHASLDLGASLGIPALTAHRCLTVGQDGVSRLGPGALSGRNVLVVGGAGAVGNAAIQLARWAGATVAATVSSPEKAALARSAGAQHTIDYLREDPARAVRDALPDGAHIVVDVAPRDNAVHYPAWVARGGTVAIYAFGGGELFTLPIQAHFDANTRLQLVLVYTVPESVKDAAVADISAAVAAGALGVGEERGLPLHRFLLERTPQAHDAVQAGAIGKVLIDVAAP